MLDRLAKLDVHVRVDRHEAALVLGVPPLQTDDDGLVDTGSVCDFGEISLGGRKKKACDASRERAE